MKTMDSETVNKARFYVTAVSTALAGTRFRSTIRRTIGKFNTAAEAQAFAGAQARRPEVRNGKSRIRFVIRHDGKTLARIKVQEAI
ncbi:MAG: hypothetical protein WC421_07525 [Elusimicrobiales bacterium]